MAQRARQASEVLATMGDTAVETTERPDTTQEEFVAVRIPVPDAVVDARREYWAGVMPGAPINGAVVGGQDFPARTELVEPDGASGDTMRTPLRGTFCKLTDAQVEKIKADLPYRWVRKTGKIFQIISSYKVNGRRFMPRVNPATDTPLAKYLYLIPVKGRGESVRAIAPISMAG